MKIVNLTFVLLIIASCGSKKEKVVSHRMTRQEICLSLKEIVKSLNLNTTARYEKKRDIYLLEKPKNFTDDPSGILLLANYIRHVFLVQNPKFPDKITLVIHCSTSENIAYIDKTLDYEKQNVRYWKYLEYALSKITFYDVVFFNLSRKFVNENMNYPFKGNIWELILNLANNEKHSDIYFLAFYNWSKIPFDDELRFNQQKMDFYLKDLKINPAVINDDYIDSLFKKRLGTGFFR